MKIAIAGIGGVGGYYGGKLAYAYERGGQHEVYFIARGEHLAKIKENGLILDAVDGTYTCRPKLATDKPEEIGTVDMVILCTKSYDLEETAQSLKPIVSGNTYVLPLLNGVENDVLLRRNLGKGKILNGCVYIVSYIEKPGTVKQDGGNCKLFFGGIQEQVEELEYIDEIFKGAGIKSNLQRDIDTAIWSKYLFICAYAGITAYYNTTIGPIIKDPQNIEMLRGMMTEVEQIARKKGVPLPDDIVGRSMKLALGMDYDASSSLQRDIEKGRKNELEIFNGTIVRMGQELNIETPFNKKVYEGIKNRL